MAADSRIKKAIVLAKDLAAMSDEGKYHFRFRVKSAQDDTIVTPWSIKYAVNAKNISAIVGSVPYSVIVTPAKRSGNITITNKAVTGSLVVLTSAGPHGMTSGSANNYVYIAGTDASIVGTYQVNNVLSTNTFSIIKSGVTSGSVSGTQMNVTIPKRVEIKWGTENTTNILGKSFDVFVRWSYTDFAATETAEWIYQATTESSSAFEVPVNAKFMQIFVQIETFPHKQTDVAKIFMTDIIPTISITDGGVI